VESIYREDGILVKNMKKIRVYTIKGCAYCHDLISSLIALNLPYHEVDVNLPQHEDEFSTLMGITGSDEIPIVVIEKRILAPNISFHTIEELIHLITDLYIY